jgi:GR25 family glycosyltransferase involved in LPS biosynthesis
MKVFVIHYTKLVERREHIKKQLARYNFDVEFITAYDKENLSKNDLALFNEGILSLSEMSTIRKHLACYEAICKEDLDYALILEDDATLEIDFESKLTKYIEQLPALWDFCFVGSGCDLHVPDRIIQKSPPGTNIFRKSNYYSSWGGSGATRCADSYIVSKRAAFKILDYLDKPDYKISKEQDHLLNEIALFKLLVTYWAEPTLVRQESDRGKFQSSLDGGVALRQRNRLKDKTDKIFDDIKDQKIDEKQRKLQQQRKDVSQQRTQQAQKVASSKTSSNTDRPLAGIRPVAGRQPVRQLGRSIVQSGAKGRFSKFGF